MNAVTLKSKPHFEILDGLRGIAAVSVVIFHFMEWVFTDPSQNFIGHGFLAVDFFFCLSGFVIGYAYDDRIGKMGLPAFFKARIIRLHPLVILGSVLGLLSFLLDPFSNYSGLYSVGKTALIFLSSLLLIPFPVMTERSFNLFSFNAPAWSLFWEYVANFFYALIFCKINHRILWLLTIAAAVALCFVGFRAKSLLGGWAGDNFWDGGARIFYSFLAGLLIFRVKLIIKNKLGFLGISVLLLLAFLMPWNEWNWISELAVVLIYFPLLIALGAGAILTENVKKLCVFSGKISYPLYMTHYAVIWIFSGYLSKQKPNANELFFVISISVLLLIGVAYLAMVLYDIPVRNYLNRRFRKA